MKNNRLGNIIITHHTTEHAMLMAETLSQHLLFLLSEFSLIALIFWSSCLWALDSYFLLIYFSLLVQETTGMIEKETVTCLCIFKNIFLTHILEFGGKALDKAFVVFLEMDWYNCVNWLPLIWKWYSWQWKSKLHMYRTCFSWASGKCLWRCQVFVLTDSSKPLQLSSIKE